MSNSTLLTIILTAAVLVVIGLQFHMLRNVKRFILAEVEKTGAKNISVKYVLIDEDGLMGTYDVRYHDAQGLFHVKKCMVHMTYSNTKIYWINGELL